MLTNSSSVSRIVIITALLCVGSVAVAIVSMNNAHATRDQLVQADAELAKLQVTSKAAAQAAAEAERLRKKLEQQDTEFNAVRAELAKLKEPAGTVAADPETYPRVSAPRDTAAGNSGGRSWMERLKEEDPERYKKMQEDRDKRRQDIAKQFQEALGRIDQRLQTATTPEEVNLLNSLASTLDKVDELRKSWENLRSLPEEDRRDQAAKLGAESMQTYQQLTELRAKDRQLQLQQLAGQVGYKDSAQSQQFVENVSRIYSETDTSINRLLGFGPGGFGRGGFGGGSGGPGGAPPSQP